MCAYYTNFSNFFAKIHLSKSGLFGVKEQIIIILSRNLILVEVDLKSKKIFPFKKGDKIDLEKFSNWVSINKYELQFTTKNSKFKRELYFYFDDIILNNENKKKESANNLFKYLKSLFSFEVFIKK